LTVDMFMYQRAIRCITMEEIRACVSVLAIQTLRQVTIYLVGLKVEHDGCYIQFCYH